MKHHLIKNLDINTCLYCNHNLSGLQWDSHFELEHHYKSIKCPCGRHNTVKVRFYGSGHDQWLRTNSGAAMNPFETAVSEEHKKIK